MISKSVQIQSNMMAKLKAKQCATLSIISQHFPIISVWSIMLIDDVIIALLQHERKKICHILDV